jgi:precorrin-6Y C5,15-methyltransferase (decarboxylating)
VGLNPQGALGLVPVARAAIEQAELVVGSRRQLALVQSLLHRDTLLWPTPFSEGIAKILARRGRSTCVLATGDPFYFGVGATLAPHLERSEFVCHPAPSSMSLAAARLGWSLQDTDVVSLHGRDLHAIIRYLQPKRRVLALAWDQKTPAQLAELLTARGLGGSRMHVLEVLGGSDERVRSCLARDFDLAEIADLNSVALEIVAEPGALVMPCRGSLPDTAFEHDGQLTKQDIRALTLSALAPRPGERLWDVGAGAGSIGIEWMLSHPACQAIGVEREPQRCARMRRNALALGVPTLEIVEATAPAGLDGLPAPDAIFIGGGAGAVFERCWRALAPGGRLVMNGVALETEALMLAWYAAHGGELRRLSIESAVQLGSMTGWKPAMPITQWRIVKP